jgi:bifunctional non-homologous end joining protein LigD
MSGSLSPLPPLFRPMLPTLVKEPFDSADHLFEVKWDGVRLLGFCDSESTRLFSRSEREVTHQYPEFADLHRRLRVENAVLDGEIVALDSASRPSFELLQHRINLSRPSDIQRGMERIPLDLVLFDIPFAAGAWLGGAPLVERRERLDVSVEFGDRVMRSDPILEHGTALFNAAKARGLEGVVGKHRLSHYIPGKRTRDWLKVKTVYDLDCVFGGFTPGLNSRSSSLGALLVGLYDQTGLRYIGSVGTGFKEKTLAELKKKLESIETPVCPFSEPVRIKGARWVEPKLVCVVEYRELTSGLKLRAPSFKGLREDKRPEECVLSDQLPAGV